MPRNTSGPPLSYRGAGVDIDAGEALVEAIKPFAKRTLRPEVLALTLWQVYSMIRKGHAENRFAWTIYKIQAALKALERELGSDEEFDAENENPSEHGVAKLKAVVNLITKAHEGR